MTAKFPTPDQFLGISCLVVGVGPRGDTSMAAYVLTATSCSVPEHSIRSNLIPIPCSCRRVSIVDYRGNVLMDEYIQPMMRVTDYRTAMNGIEAHHLAARKYSHSWPRGHEYVAHHEHETCTAHARPFPDVQRDVANYIRNKIIVGYTLWNDLSGTTHLP